MAATRLNPRLAVVSGVSMVEIALDSSTNGHFWKNGVWVPFGRDLGTTDYVVHATPLIAGGWCLTPRGKATNGFYVIAMCWMATSKATIQLPIQWTAHLL